MSDPESKLPTDSNDSIDASDIIDLTQTEDSTGDVITVAGFEEKSYDPRPQEDSARRCIAYILLAILGGILAWTYIILSFCPNSIDNIIKVLQIILGPIIALVSAATGFYYGSKRV